MLTWVVDRIVDTPPVTVRILPARRLYRIEAVTPDGIVADLRYGVWVDGP